MHPKILSGIQPNDKAQCFVQFLCFCVSIIGSIMEREREGERERGRERERERERERGREREGEREREREREKEQLCKMLTFNSAFS